MMIFTLSPDENPGDPGSTAGGFNERAENLKVIGFLGPALERCGQTVRFDASVTAVDRVARANGDGTDVLVAVAHNAGGGEGSVLLFCATPSGHSFGQQDQAAKAVGDALVAAGVALKWSPYDVNVYECCAFNRDTVYVEVLFQDNARDAARMRQPGYHHDAAEAIARGLAAAYGFAYSTPPTATPQEVHKMAAALTVIDLPAGKTKAIGGPDQHTLWNVVADGRANLHLQAVDLHGVSLGTKDLSTLDAFNQAYGTAADLGASAPFTLIAINGGPGNATVTLHRED